MVIAAVGRGFKSKRYRCCHFNYLMPLFGVAGHGILKNDRRPKNASPLIMSLGEDWWKR
jgi:hypothetical protein